MINFIRKRFPGEYRRKERKLLWNRVYQIERRLDELEENDNLRRYLGGLIDIHKKIESSYKVGYFIGMPLARKLLGRYDELHSELIHSLEDKEYLDFGEIKLPKFVSEQDRKTFIDEVFDVLFPFLLNKYGCELEESFYREGPYEFNEKICLKKDDVVFDCGANMGLFSAVASSKKCKIYSFEPMMYTIDNYLRKTAELNKNIEICPFALSDKQEILYFDLITENIASSKQGKQNKTSQTIQAITLDEFVKEKKIERVDFIKADIEGSERKMLIGAQKVIERFSPKISICTYHLPDDPVVLRKILLDIQPKYKIIERYEKMYAYVES